LIAALKRQMFNRRSACGSLNVHFIVSSGAGMRLARISLGFVVCLLLLGVVLQPAAVSAQQPGQEKRIALVVGNGAYAKGPLATAANDAGLIAQTLQAAGFDVIGARDLDGDTLRKSFRDFMQKAQSSDDNTVAMIYLAGYGVQLAGENYYIPVDSAVSRDTDIPTEGLRISDYIRQLAAIPLKASVVVLDAARQQPFIEGGQPVAGGLALVEPEPNMLIAFNAAPGTVAPSENGSYGIYAQSLAEMIRTGGLALPEVFDRVRLRVNEATKGAQVPWDAQKIQAQFSFFDRAPDAPAAQAQPAQVAAIHDRPIRELGVQDAYAAAIERDTLPAYEEFLAAYAGDPLAKRVRAIVAARREAITWRRTYRTDTPDAYWSYLKRYPDGPHAGDARRRLAILTAPLEPPPSFAMLDYDVPPPPPDEIVYVDRPVLMFADPDFDFVPPPPPPVYFLPPPPPDFVVLPPPIEPVGLFILPQPVFVPIPVYVRPPAFVAPPPNNIIFNNIHNTTVINNVINQPPAPAAGGPRGGAAAPAQSVASATAATLPPAVAQRAALIQQGKAPMPLSASINAAGRAGTPQPANGTPSALAHPQAAPSQAAPSQPGPAQGVSRANALPVPGNHGAPPAPSAATGAVNPHAGLAPPSAPSQQGQGQAPGQPGLHPDHRVQPGAAPNVQANRTPPGAPAAPAIRPVPGPQHPVAPTATAPTRPELRSRVAPPAVARPAPPPVAARPMPPPIAARPSPPPAMAARPVAPMVHAAPPPPPRPAAPPPMARPSPPPAAAMARPMAPPPPMARPAAPPPRPAAPPPAKRCPPNVPHC
jgi:uncharacterized caspase-like protein